MLAPVVLAALFAPVCHGQLAPPTPIEQAMSYRRNFGMRHDRAYVRRVQRSDARRDDQGFAFTPREWRYWRMRSRIELSDKRPVDRYLDRHPGLSGGMSIEDDWPAGPYLQVRLTRDQALHEAALRRIYRFRLRTVAVRFAEADLRALQDRISADGEALEAEGFDVRGLAVDGDANRVQVQLVTARSDHAAYFQARYGPAVTTYATAEPTRLECTKLERVRVSSTGRSLRLDWLYSSGDAFERVELAEHDDRVEVGIVLRVDAFARHADARPARTRVPLSRPLGGRRVIDAATGLRPSPAR
jgi:hypothetical protein